MRYSSEERYDIFMSVAFEGAARTALQLEEHNGGPMEFRERVLKGTADLGRSALGERRSRIASCASDTYLDEFIGGLERDGIVPVTRSHPAYPELLREIDDPPFVLYERGAMAGSPIRQPISVIGTRRCSDYGEQVATLMGHALATAGATVISGLAYGCDSFAHEGALLAHDSSFPTAAVLGNGVLLEKKDSTKKTMEKILERGMVISEYLPRTGATSYSFPMRNRIISGLSRALLVVEAGKKSGTMITVSCALDQGRDVYAVPCRITEKLNGGTNEMLSMGCAQPVYSADDLLSLLGLKLSDSMRSGADGVYSEAYAKLGDEQKKLLDQLALGEKSFDTLIEKTGISVEKLNLHLTELEFSGLIKQLPGRIYSIN